MSEIKYQDFDIESRKSARVKKAFFGSTSQDFKNTFKQDIMDEYI